ncbi:hypothetical protein ACP4OV_006966 [Aristida adscensionis]
MAASPQALLSCALFSVLLLVPHACVASTLQERCRSYADDDEPSYDFCLRTLQSDSRASAADERGLFAIAARAGQARAKATEAKIEARLAAETAAARRDGLAACARVFATAAHRLGAAARDVTHDVGAGGLRWAQRDLSHAFNAPDRCDGAFAAAGQQGSPLSANDREIDKVLELAASILPVPPSPSATTRKD